MLNVFLQSPYVGNAWISFSIEFQTNYMVVRARMCIHMYTSVNALVLICVYLPTQGTTAETATTQALGRRASARAESVASAPTVSLSSASFVSIRLLRC